MREVGVVFLVFKAISECHLESSAVHFIAGLLDSPFFSRLELIKPNCVSGMTRDENSDDDGGMGPWSWR